MTEAPKASRRGFFLGLSASVVAGFGALSFGLRELFSRPWVRPPSAGEDFERRCIGCFRCAEVCPPGAIKLDGLLSIGGSSAPYIDPQRTACVLCMQCTEVCPTDALTPISADLESIHAQVSMGRPALDKSRCITLSRKGACRLCYEVCPYPDQAVRLTGIALGPIFDPKQCVGCGLCAEACPEDAKAIDIVVEL